MRMSEAQIPGKDSLSLAQGKQPTLRLLWDIGTAYDLFVSLDVLHNPDNYGLRASWAAGVRSRLSPTERKFLEEAQTILWVPLTWIHTLPEPKDAASVLWGLRQIPPEQRLGVLMEGHKMDLDIREIYDRVSGRCAWDEKDLGDLRSAYSEHDHPPKTKTLTAQLEWWTRPAEFGNLLLSALQSYVGAFFAEEEKRIAPMLRKGLEQAQELAEKLPVPDLLAELSQGVHFEESLEATELVLAPSYWSTPLIIFARVSDLRMLLLFGARPAEASLVPGEQVPDALLRALKAMADPTRLKILHYLSIEPLTPAELSRMLRLRAPTVTHHLRALRLAGLVHLTLQAGEEKRYAARLEAIDRTSSNLHTYLKENIDED
jgi:DNA-binding transcriptional ArsR family regulator